MTGSDRESDRNDEQVCSRTLIGLLVLRVRPGLANGKCLVKK